MKVKVLGSRGEISESHDKVSKHSGVLIENVLFDCGELEYLQYKPKAVFVTHLHPDHYVDVEHDVPVYSIEKPIKALNWIKLKELQTYTVNSLKVTPIPTVHSKKVKSCAFLIENSKRILYTGDLIWINKKYHDMLKNLDLVITEASSFNKDLIRRDKDTGEIYGHSSANKLYDLFVNKLNAKQILFTHYGKWFVENVIDGEIKLKSLGDNVIVGYDGMTVELQLTPEDVESITPQHIAKSPEYALILVEPHGKMIYEGVKKGIVKSRKFTEHINEDLYLISGNMCYGIIQLKEPVEINKEQFEQLYDKHKISEDERLEWCKKEKEWCKFPLYYYEFMFIPFEEPIPVRVKVTGPQVFVKVDNIEFIEIDKMCDEELEYYHALCHKWFREIGDVWCKLHFRIANEMLSRNIIHLDMLACDRVVSINKLIRESSRNWVKEYISNIPKYSDEQLRDDYRICLAWYSSIRNGKQIVKHTVEGDIPITIDDCKKIAVEIVKELLKRGTEFSKPEAYKEYARELFEYVIKEIGEDKFTWKNEELTLKLPVSFQVTDITVDFVNKLSDKELEDLWVWLHDKWREHTEGKSVTEDYLNANIIIQIERYKRGLIDETYEDKDLLDEESRYAWQEYGVLEEIEPEIVTLETVLEAIKDAGIIPVKGQPFAGYLCGRIVNEGKVTGKQDIDILFRQRPDPRLVFAVKTHLPKWLADRIHIFFDSTGPAIGYSIPVYGYALNPLPKELMIKGYGPYRELSELKVGKYIVGVKPKSGFGKYEFWDVKELWSFWASKHISNGIWVEEKVDGRRFQIHIDENNNVKMFTEDTKRDRAEVFPEIVKELQSLNIPNSILDGEVTAWIPPKGVEPRNARAKREVGELMPREDTAAITVSKSLSEDFRRKLVLVVYDVMKLKGEDVVDLPYSKRRELYESIIGKNLKYIDTVRGELANTMDEFFKLVDKYRRINGSEGVMCKDAKSFVYPVKYSGENRSEELCKLKNLKEIDCIVLGVKQKKDRETGKPLPNYMYECYIEIPKEEVVNWYPDDVKEFNGKFYAKIGTSYSTKVKAKIGDIITVMPIRVRFYEKDGKRRVTWMFPYFKEVRKDKTQPDTLTTAERLAKVGTAPLSEELTEDIVVKVLLSKCPFYSEFSICPLRKRYGIHRAIVNLAIVEEEVLKYPVMCPLARLFKCPYLKDYYYGFVGVKYNPELSNLPFEMLDTFQLPKWVFVKLQSKYMEAPKGEYDFVMQAHILTKEFKHGDKKIPKSGSQHIDFRMSVNGYLIGWSIVGGSVDKFITPKTLLEKKGKGFRAEEKAIQPKVWLFKDKEVAEAEDFKVGQEVPEMFDVVVGQGEPRGKMIVLTRGKVIYGYQEPYFHEYFLKDDKYFKDWTRIVFRAVKVPVIDPDTKKPTGKYERMWRVMIPKDQLPYYLSKRAMSKGKKPPKDNPEPFPVEWVKRNFPKEYEAWKEYLKTVELSSVKYSVIMHQYRGPIHVRGLYIRDYYLLIDDKNSKTVRVFKIDNLPMFSSYMGAYDWSRVDRKYLDYEGETKPQSFFNPTKETVGEIKVVDKGVVDINVDKFNGVEHISLDFKGEMLKGKWVLIQEDKDSDVYVFKKVEQLSRTFEYVYHRHVIDSSEHYDVRINRNGYLDEFNLEDDINKLQLGEQVKAVRKKCEEPNVWFITVGDKVKVPIGYVEVLDSGTVTIFEDTEDFMSMIFNGKLLSNVYLIAKRLEDGIWTVYKEALPVGLDGNPLTGKPYSPFVIKTKSTWKHFRVYLYDPREFTRAEPDSKVKKYLPDLDIPKGVTVTIGLYPVMGRIHHARVMYVDFDKDLWSESKAVKWIKDNKLHLFVSPMIREQ